MISGLQKDQYNILLRTLHPADYSLLRPHLTRVATAPREVLLSAGQPIRFLDFPETTIAAISDLSPDTGTACLTALVGREGFVGWPVLMAAGVSPHDVTAGRDAGHVLRIEAACLLRACSIGTALETCLLRFIHVLMVQMSATIVSSKTDPIERRLARLLLMHHDRCGGDALCVTHQDLAAMLSIRRASVTDALHVLEGERLITSTRTQIVIRDRPALRNAAGSCYGGAEAQYRRTISPLDSWT